MTDMLHFYLKLAWEEVQAQQRKWMDPPALVPVKPDVPGMLADIQAAKEMPKPKETPLSKMQKASAKSKAERKQRKTAKRKTKATAAA